MLKIYDVWFEEDSPAWRKLQRNFCNSVLECLEKSWIEALPEEYFPKEWDVRKSDVVIEELRRKLESDDEEKLTELESYVLYSVIKKVCENLENTEDTYFMDIDEREELAVEFNEEGECGEAIVWDYEDMRQWPRFCFPSKTLQILNVLAGGEWINYRIGAGREISGPILF